MNKEKMNLNLIDLRQNSLATYNQQHLKILIFKHQDANNQSHLSKP